VFPKKNPPGKVPVTRGIGSRLFAFFLVRFMARDIHHFEPVYHHS
jgi:hypothetical protein